MEDQEKYFRAIDKLFGTLTPDEQKIVKQTVMKKNKGDLPKILSGLFDYMYSNKESSKERFKKIFNFLFKNKFYDVLLYQ